jgi:hypothetical protein
MRIHMAYRAALGLALLAPAAGCGSDSAGPAPTRLIVVAGGDGESAPVTTGAVLTAKVTDVSGTPEEGVPVTWSVVSGGGTITSSSVTNGAGIASA